MGVETLVHDGVDRVFDRQKSKEKERHDEKEGSRRQCKADEAIKWCETSLTRGFGLDAPPYNFIFS